MGINRARSLENAWQQQLRLLPTPRPLHFLTMDDFFSPDEPAKGASDPTSDFLRREAEALGADATTFGSSSHSGAYDFEASASAFPDLDDEDGLDGFTSPPPPAVGGGAAAFGVEQRGQVSVTADNEFSAFESEYPEVEVTPAPVQVSFGSLEDERSNWGRGWGADDGSLRTTALEHLRTTSLRAHSRVHLRLSRRSPSSSSESVSSSRRSTRTGRPLLQSVELCLL